MENHGLNPFVSRGNDLEKGDVSRGKIHETILAEAVQQAISIPIGPCHFVMEDYFHQGNSTPSGSGLDCLETSAMLCRKETGFGRVFVAINKWPVYMFI